LVTWSSLEERFTLVFCVCNGATACSFLCVGFVIVVFWIDEGIQASVMILCESGWLFPSHILLLLEQPAKYELISSGY
jgi:hypothetical protein